MLSKRRERRKWHRTTPDERPLWWVRDHPPFETTFLTPFSLHSNMTILLLRWLFSHLFHHIKDHPSFETTSSDIFPFIFQYEWTPHQKTIPLLRPLFIFLHLSCHTKDHPCFKTTFSHISHHTKDDPCFKATFSHTFPIIPKTTPLWRPLFHTFPIIPKTIRLWRPLLLTPFPSYSHVNEPLSKDHLSLKTTFAGFLGWS